MTDHDGVPAIARTWRAPVSTRIWRALLHALWIYLFTSWLSGNSLQDSIVATIDVAVWAWLSFRAWTVSVTIADDTLVIRNVLSTKRVTAAHISRAYWKQAELVLERRAPKITAATPPGTRWDNWVDALRPGLIAGLSGARSAADDAADALGLPPLPARQPRLGRAGAYTAIVLGIAAFSYGLIETAAGTLPDENLSAPAIVIGGLGLVLVSALSERARRRASHTP